jgi:hypothetical protein
MTETTMTLIDQTTRSGRIDERDGRGERRLREPRPLVRCYSYAETLRQGDWLFVPAPELKVPRREVLRAQRLLSEVEAEAHVADFCYRIGGETVYACEGLGRAVGELAHRELLEVMPESRDWGWREMRRYREVYVRGRVVHRRHRPVALCGWHRVMPASGTHSAFLDG